MKRKLVLLFTLLAALLAVCLYNNQTFGFQQEIDQIESIEILYKESYNTYILDAQMPVLKTLDPAEYRPLIDAVQLAQGGRLASPGDGFGYYIIRITYHDGTTELVGDVNSGYITPDGKLKYDNFRFNKEEYLGIISSFLGEEVTEPPYDG